MSEIILRPQETLELPERMRVRIRAEGVITAGTKSQNNSVSFLFVCLFLKSTNIHFNQGGEGK